MRCEGWRRKGGAFTLGPVTWHQCKNDAVVMLTVIQEKKREELPGCMVCWEEAMSNDKIQVVKARPLTEEEKKGGDTSGNAKEEQGKIEHQ